MLTNLELYGRDMPPVSATVCNFRIEVLKERLEELMSAHYMNRDNNTIAIVVKGINFWTKLKNGDDEDEIYS